MPESLLVKPAGADCNIACTYCFYREKMALYPETKRPRMSEETLRRMLESYFASWHGPRDQEPQFSFGWQGGEPSLMGVDFFRTAFDLQRSLAPSGSTIANGFQTNGILMDDRWAQLFNQYQVLVGLSIDGPEPVHDTYRVGLNGSGTHRQVEATVRLFQKHNVQFNALVVVGRHNQDRPQEIYRYLKSLGIMHHQYIPLFEFKPDGSAYEFSVTSDGWSHFLSGIFDEWYDHDTRKVSIRHFDSVLELLALGGYNVCTMGGTCSGHLVVEHNGDIFPCDFFVDPQWRLGNVHDRADAIAAAERSPIRRRFAGRKARWNTQCDECPYLHLCSGDCVKYRPDHMADTDAEATGFSPREVYRSQVDRTGKHTRPAAAQTERMPLSYLCDGWKQFYDRTYDRFLSLADHVAKRRFGRPPAILNLRSWPEEERCFCGSGRKASNCHRSSRATWR